MIGALEASGSDWPLVERVFRQASDAGVYNHWNGHELDLHFCNAAVARAATRHACMTLAAEPDDGGSNLGLTIITGVGNHTPGGRAKAVLPREVRTFLRMGLAYPIDDPVQARAASAEAEAETETKVEDPGLEYSEVEGNAGRIHVSKSAICAWSQRCL